MNKKKLAKLLIITVLIIFFCAYIIEVSGYYEYNLQGKKNLTQESIEQFEKDVKEGKDININDYVIQDTIDYSNKLTKTTTKISLKINNYLKNRIKDIFKSLNKIIEE